LMRDAWGKHMTIVPSWYGEPADKFQEVRSIQRAQMKMGFLRLAQTRTGM
jgi:hypothetical protein